MQRAKDPLLIDLAGLNADVIGKRAERRCRPFFSFTNRLMSSPNFSRMSRCRVSGAQQRCPHPVQAVSSLKVARVFGSRSLLHVRRRFDVPGRQPHYSFSRSANSTMALR